MTEVSSPLFVGVDGGGTRTVALVGSRSDRVLGRGVAGPSNPQAVGFETAAEQISTAIRAALRSVTGGESPIASSSVSVVLDEGSIDSALGVQQITLGVAGCGRVPDRERLADLLADRLGVPRASIRVVTDVALLLPAANLSCGVALVAGTGSSAFGIAPDGRTASAGGWGYLLGDDGSAFEVGRHALRAVLRAEDGLGPPTRLTGALKQALQVIHPRDLIRVVYQSQAPRATIADLAPIVVAVARDGDATARQIVGRAGEVLGQLAGAVARRLGLGSESTVVGTGGLFQAGDLVLDPLKRSLARAGLTDFRLSDAESAIGALRLATDEVQMEIP